MKQKFLSFCSRMLLMLAFMLPVSVMADELTVNDGTATNMYVPVYGNYFDYGFRSQFVIPADDLADMTNGTITSMKFYSSAESSSWSGATYQITLVEVSAGTTLASAFQSSVGGTVVFNGMQNIASGELLITFSDEYAYQGGDLLVETSSTGGGSYASKSFYGASVSGGSRYASGSTSMTAAGTAQTFRPKVTFEYDPAATGSCARPGKVVMSEITSASAVATWTAAEGVTEYQYLLVAQGAELDWAAAESISDTTVSLTDLDANTAYLFAVRSYCGANEGEQSNEQKANFRTACGTYDLAVETYYCGFEAADGFSGSSLNVPCMAHGKLTSSSYCNEWGLSSSTYANSGQAAWALVDYESYSTYYSSKAWWAFPQIIVPEEGEYEVTFYARGYYDVLGDSLAVYINETQSMTGATRLGSLDYTQLADEYNQYSFDLPAGTYYVILAGYTAADDYSGGTVLVDDVMMRAKPNCRPSKDLHFESSDFTSATFAWTPANGEEAWQLQYKASDATEFETVNLTEPTFTVDGLEIATFYTYNFILHSDCEGELSVDSVKYTIDFATACGVMTPENDSIVFVGDAFTPCFSQALIAGTNTYEWTASSGYYQIQGAFSTAANARALVFPQMSIGDNWELLFDAWAGGENAADSILVYVSETPSLEGAIYVGAVKNFGTAAPADPYRLTLPEEAANQDLYLIFVGYHYNRLYLDNVILADKPNCMPITGLDYVGAAADEENEGLFAATFNWNRGGEEDLWACYYAIKVDTVGAEYEYFGGVGIDYATETPEDTIFTVHALEPNTRYVVLVGVQSACDGGENLGAAVEREFSLKTPCVAISAIGYEEGFEDAESGSGKLPDCWTYVKTYNGSGVYPYVGSSSSSAHGGSKYLYFYNGSNAQTGFSIVAMPQFEENINDLRLQFYYKNYSATASYGYFIVGTISNLADTASFHPYQVLPGVTTYTKATIDFQGIPEEDKYIAIKYTSGNGWASYIDDIVIEAQPSCVPVRNLQVEDITSTSAKIAWAQGKEETEWSVEVKKGTTVVYKDTIDVPYLLLDTLTPATSYSYTVLVKAMCDGVEAEDFLPATTLTFNTECLAVSVFPWTEDFEQMTASAVAPCWDNSASSTSTATGTNSYYVWGVYSASSNKMLRMYNYYVSSGTAIVNSPTIELPAEQVYNLKFDYSNRANCGDMKVKISTDGGATFTELGSYPVTNSSSSYTDPGTFTSVEIPLTAYVGQNVKFQFYALANYSQGAIFLDNVTIEEAPSCLKPENIRLVEGSVTLHEADFAWDGDAAQYEVSLGTQTAIVNTNGMHMSGLEAGKNYVANIQVRAICAEGDTSAWSAVTPVRFATECEVVSTFPWSNDFEAYESSLDANNIACWSAEWAQGTATKAAWSIAASSAASGTKSISSTYISSQTSLSQLALPQMNIPEANAYEFVFKVRRDADSQSYKTDELRIFANTTPDTIGATRLFNVFRQCSGVPVEAEAGTYQYAVTLPNAGEQYIVLQYYSEDGLGIYLDDFMVREIPSCSAASDLHVVDTLIGLDTAVIAWTPYDVENLNARVVLVNGTDTIVDELVNDSIYVIRGLNPSTAYAFNAYVYTVCDELQAVDAAVKALSFATECAPIAALPWSTDFEAEKTGASNVPTCWTRPAGATYPYVYSTSTLDGSKCLYAYSSAELYIVSPEFGVELNGAVLSFLYKQTSATSSYPQLHVGVVSDPNSMADYQEIAAIERATSNTEVEITLENVPATHKYIVFKQSAASSSYSSTSIYVDNILVEPAPTCVKPSNIHVASVGQDSAVIAWSGNAAQYELIIADTEKADTIIVSDTCYVLRGLTHSTAYLYAAMLRGVCAEGDSSKWAIASNLSFTTECAPIAELPWSENFESPFMGCWTLDGVTAATTTATTGYAISGLGMLKFNKQNAVALAVLPEFAAPLSSLQFSYNWRDEGTGNYTGMGYLKAGYVTDPSDASTFVAIADHNYRHFSSYEANTIFFPEEVPAGARIAFYYSGQTGNDYLFVDDILVEVAPNCVKPTKLHVASVGLDSAVIAWTGNAAQYELIIADAEKADTVIVNDTCYVLRGLTHSTPYTYAAMLRGICAEGDSSVWAIATFNFLTECAPIATFPWTEGFEDLTLGSSSANAPLCWDLLNANDGTYPYIFVNNSASYVKTGSKSLYFQSSGSRYGYAILPEFEDLNDKQIRFSYKDENVASSGYLYLGYMTDITDETSFVEIQNYARSTSWVNTESLVLPEIPAGARLAFKYGGAAANYYLGIDDIVIEAAPACKKVKDLVREELTATSVTFGWTPVGQEAEWIVEIFKGATRLDSVAVATPSFSIDTLLPETAYSYTISVVASCGEGETSAALSQTFSFTTLPACPQVTNIAVASTTENSATITWEAGLDENAWIVKIYLAGELQDSVEVSAENYTIMDLNANTKYTYTVVVLAKCGEEDFSRPTQAALTFRTAMPADAVEVMDKTVNRQFTADFSSTDEQTKWLVIGGGANQFTFGTAAAALLNEATAALYVSNDGSAYNYNVNAYSSSIAARSIQLPAVDSLLVEFDWLANGETSWDYGRAFLAPADMSLAVTESTQPVAKIADLQVAPGNNYKAVVPEGAIALVPDAMGGKTVAQSVSKKIETVEAGEYRLIFVWGNDGSSGTQNPLSICNLSVKILDSNNATALDDVNADENVEKFLYNGKVYIRRGNTVYTVLGQQVK